MSTTDSVSDPLVSSIALVLKVPLVQLYALLWRAGVVEIRHSDPTTHRSSRQALVAACAGCPNHPKPGSERLSRRSPRRRPPEPVPSRGDQAVCSRATG
ncbi:Rv1535 domain-containing protein [Mycobacterium sp. 1245805.9]|uniref:Rv1535 domain-containing protein n=1 Tax=Mycobacterium sp. 1245805.9 TaxID=1856862 RepID=UPI002100D56C|nr:Rv1535 domain-containing protein [Mycobacterium sp. 1245805.9]